MKNLIAALVLVSTFPCFSMDSSNSTNNTSLEQNKIVLTKELLQHTPRMIYGHDHSPSMLKYQKPLSKKSQDLRMLRSQSPDRSQQKETGELYLFVNEGYEEGIANKLQRAFRPKNDGLYLYPYVGANCYKNNADKFEEDFKDVLESNLVELHFAKGYTYTMLKNYEKSLLKTLEEHKQIINNNITNK